MRVPLEERRWEPPELPGLGRAADRKVSASPREHGLVRMLGPTVLWRRPPVGAVRLQGRPWEGKTWAPGAPVLGAILLEVKFQHKVFVSESKEGSLSWPLGSDAPPPPGSCRRTLSSLTTRPAPQSPRHTHHTRSHIPHTFTHMRVHTQHMHSHTHVHTQHARSRTSENHTPHTTHTTHMHTHHVFTHMHTHRTHSHTS